MSEKTKVSIAWSKGFFRLWVFLSLLWTAIAGLFIIEGFPDEYSFEAKTFVYTDTPLGQALTNHYGSTAWADSGQGDMILMPTLIDALLGAREAKRSDDALALNGAIESAKERLSQRQSATLVHGLVAVVSLPALLLVLGILVAWVVRGFRTSP